MPQITPYQNCAPQAPKFVFVISFFSAQNSRKLCAKFSFEQIACRKTKAKIRAQQTHPILQYVLGCAHLHPCVAVCGLCLRLLSDDRGRGSMSSSEMAVAQIAHSDGALVIAQHQQTLDLVRQNALLAVAKHGLNEREHLVRSSPVFFRFLPDGRCGPKRETFGNFLRCSASPQATQISQNFPRKSYPPKSRNKFREILVRGK